MTRRFVLPLLSLLPVFPATAAPPPTSVSLAAAPAPEGPVLDLSLREALDRLDDANPTLRQAEARIGLARALALQRAAPLLPDLAAVGGYARNNEAVQLSAGGRDVLLQPKEQWTAGLEVRIPLFVARAWAELAAGLEAVEGSRALADATRVALRAGLAKAAWLGEAAESLVEATERAVLTAARHDSAAIAGIEVGVLPPVARLQTQGELAARQADLVRARAGLHRARLAAGALLGVDGPVWVHVPAPGDGAPPTREALSGPAAREAVARRPEADVLVAELRVARAQQVAGWLQHAPSLAGSFGVWASDVPYPTGESSAWRLTLDLEWTLFDGALRYGQIAEARAREDIARSALAEGALTASREIQEAEDQLGVQQEGLRLSGIQRAAAATASEVADRAFQEGTVGALEPIDAAQRAYMAEIGAIDARAQLAVAWVTWRQAMGLPEQGEAPGTVAVPVP